jgi:hypothetical protein
MQVFKSLSPAPSAIAIAFFLSDVGISSPVVFKVEGSGHQRSGSSTDSFVCVSEETGLEGEGPLSSRDTDSWEHLGSELGGSGSRNSRAKLSDMGEVESNGESNGGTLLKEREALLRSIELMTEGKEGKTRGEDGDSSSSDWENWED